jgi:uncharacterized protein YlaN (UPF0358 family)
MASRKVYYSNKKEDEDSMSNLEIYQNVDGNLFVALSQGRNDFDVQFVALPPEDAKEIITNLAREFNMLDENSVEGNVLFIL